MKITLINPSKIAPLEKTLHKLFPVQGTTLPYLESLIGPHHETRIMDELFEPILFDEPTDLVAITTLTPTATRAYRIADEFRRRGRTVIMGGPHVSACPEEALNHCDSVAVGNAETTIPRIIFDFEQGLKLQRMYHNRVPTDLPRLEVDKNNMPRKVKTLLASRGCEMSCKFCTMQSLFGKFYLQRDIQCVMNELKATQSKYIFFADDNFYGSSAKSRAFYDAILDELKNKNLRWMAQCRLDAISSENVLAKFQAAKCGYVLIGFESIDANNNSETNKQKIDPIRYAIDIKRIHDHGIGIVGSFIFGFDSDTPETIDKTVEFCIENKIEYALFTILTPFPGTQLFKEMKAEGRILSDNWDDYTMHKCVYRPRNFTPEELETLVEKALNKFYSVSSITRRLRIGQTYDVLSHYVLPNILRGIDVRFRNQRYSG